MSKTLAVTLDDEQNRFVNAQVAADRYASAEEVVREGLRLLAEREAERDRIRAALIAGEESGIVETTVTEIFAEAISHYRAKRAQIPSNGRRARGLERNRLVWGSPFWGKAGRAVFNRT